MANLNQNMTQRSMFGTQPLSARRSSASYGFGSSTREHQAKRFISQAHAATAGASCSPGPASYELRSSVGRQEDARKASAPAYVFSTGDRFKFGRDRDSDTPRGGTPGPGDYSTSSFGTQASSSARSQPKFGFGSAGRHHLERVFVSNEHNKSLFGKHSPGPCSYNHKGSIGKQDTSRLNGLCATQPSWRFGSTKRFQYDHVKRAMNSPGPGSYALGQSVGVQSLSTRQSAPLAGFGSSTREHAAKVYMSPEHEKMNHGMGSPGPCKYTLQQSVGVQRLSKDHSAASWGFGTADRWSKQSNQESPGPGAYCV